MNHQFDELTKSMAQSVTRRAALKKFGLGLVAGVAASLGITSGAAAGKNSRSGYCEVYGDIYSAWYTGVCVDPTTCQRGISSSCKGKVNRSFLAWNPCGYALPSIDTKQSCSV